MHVESMLAVLAAIALAACSSGDAGPPSGVIDENTLTQTGGCGNVSLFAHSGSGDFELRFGASGAIDAAEAEGGAAVFVYELPDGQAAVELLYGRLLYLACNDAVHGDTQVVATYTAVSGTATLTLNLLPPQPQPPGIPLWCEFWSALGKHGPSHLWWFGPCFLDHEPPPETLATATLLLEDVVLRSEVGAEFRLPRFEIPETTVGFTIP